MRPRRPALRARPGRCDRLLAAVALAQQRRVPARLEPVVPKPERVAERPHPRRLVCRGTAVGDGRLELDEGSEPVDVVEVDADVLAQQQVAALAHDVGRAERRVERRPQRLGIGDVDEAVAALAGRRDIGPLVGDELRPARLLLAELEPAARGREVRVALAQDALVARAERPGGGQRGGRIGVAGLELEVAAQDVHGARRDAIAGRRPDRVRPHGGAARRRPPAALAPRGRAAGGGDVAGGLPPRARRGVRGAGLRGDAGPRDRARHDRDAARGDQVRRPALPVAVVAILRAGLGMVDGFLRQVPEADIGHLGMYRDEESLQPVPYYESLPASLPDAAVFVVDPMLATGGSATAAIGRLRRPARAACTSWGSWRLPRASAPSTPPTPRCRSPWPRSIASSTDAATSAPASATPATGCSAPNRRLSGRSLAVRRRTGRPSVQNRHSARRAQA